MTLSPAPRHGPAATVALLCAVLLTACQAPPKPAPQPVPVVPQPVPVAPPPVPEPPPPPPPAPPAAPAKVSNATTPRDYRRDAAGHLYERNPRRLDPGKLPPLIYAVGVLQVELDRLGNVTSISWMRAPSHAPEVVEEIERTVREASPYPAPLRMGGVTYTDTWLWDESGRFQLDTLTEGQR